MVKPNSEYIDMGLEFIVNFKILKNQGLLKKRRLKVFGSGQLVQSLSRVLNNKNLDVDAFRERKTIVRVNLDGIPVRNVENDVPDKNSDAVIVAAQPVREEIYQLFLDNGWVEWDDFLVIL